MRWRNLSALPSKPWGGRFMADSLLRFLDTEQIGRQLGQVILTGLLGQWAGKPQPPGDQFHAILVLVVTPVTGITVKRVADGLQVAADLVLASGFDTDFQLGEVFIFIPRQMTITGQRRLAVQWRVNHI